MLVMYIQKEEKRTEKKANEYWNPFYKNKEKRKRMKESYKKIRYKRVKVFFFLFLNIERTNMLTAYFQPFRSFNFNLNRYLYIYVLVSHVYDTIIVLFYLLLAQNILCM